VKSSVSQRLSVVRDDPSEQRIREMIKYQKDWFSQHASTLQKAPHLNTLLIFLCTEIWARKYCQIGGRAGEGPAAQLESTKPIGRGCKQLFFVLICNINIFPVLYQDEFGKKMEVMVKDLSANVSESKIMAEEVPSFLWMISHLVSGWTGFDYLFSVLP
jgi:hypothetical protein